MGRGQKNVNIKAKKAYRYFASKPMILFGAWDRNRTGTVLSTEGF
jgi:hypothetical protein